MEKHKEGSIRYHWGIIQINTPGYYYLYSQMFCHDGSSDTFQMIHEVHVNGNKVLESSSGIANNRSKYVSNYNGGVFLLRSLDKISIRIPI